MGRAEVGSTKWVANQSKSKGLTRLRWYCQICEKACRDDNGYKMHVQSESHVRKLLVVGEDPRKAIKEFSDQFLKDFTQQLKTAHGSKSIHINTFYQEYIHNKEHIHMNATQWSSLTELAKYLGKEGICRVEETEKGLDIAWIDNSPEALRRQEAIRKKELLEKGDDQREERLLKEQRRRAEAAAEAKRLERGEDGSEEEDVPEDRGLQLQNGEKLTLSFGSKTATKKDDKPSEPAAALVQSESTTTTPTATPDIIGATETPSEPAKPTGFSFSAKPATKNVFAQAKKNALGGGTKKLKIEQPKKMSEAERIMRAEMDKKRGREAFGSGGGPHKKPRF